MIILPIFNSTPSLSPRLDTGCLGKYYLEGIGIYSICSSKTVALCFLGVLSFRAPPVWIISFDSHNTGKWTENSRKGDPAECTRAGSWKEWDCQGRHRPCSLHLQGGWANSLSVHQESHKSENKIIIKETPGQGF